jgi:alkanesulfonate monooxygenase SsuD/methylene tetrahydromethanopterin reductase-like flavin-dependent oxidoreductase (luciferase family)
VTPKGFQRSSAAIDEALERAGRIGQPFELGLLLHFLLDDSHAAVTKAQELNFGFPRDLKLAANVEQLKQLALVGSADDVLARLQQFIDVGCTTFCVSPIEKETEAYRRQVERFAAEVLPRLKTGSTR